MPDLVARLAAALGRRVGPDEALAVAVSGGADSLALLHLAATAFPGRITALTVDHGLRVESTLEAEAVKTLCAGINVPHVTLRWPGPHPRSNIQAAARSARYALMADWCEAHGHGLLMTAHHADDQAETVLMRLARGSGSAGLAGIRPQRRLDRLALDQHRPAPSAQPPDRISSWVVGQGARAGADLDFQHDAPKAAVLLVRPLLGCRRAELSALVAALGWRAVIDPANADPRYDRTAARSLLATTPWLAGDRLAATAAHLADVEAALDWATARAWAGGATVSGDTVTLSVAGLPGEIVRRLVERALRQLAPAALLDGNAVTAVMANLMANGSATLAGVMAQGGDVWRFKLAPPRRKSRQNAA